MIRCIPTPSELSECSRTFGYWLDVVGKNQVFETPKPASTTKMFKAKSRPKNQRKQEANSNEDEANVIEEDATSPNKTEPQMR